MILKNAKSHHAEFCIRKDNWKLVISIFIYDIMQNKDGANEEENEEEKEEKQERGRFRRRKK